MDIKIDFEKFVTDDEIVVAAFSAEEVFEKLGYTFEYVEHPPDNSYLLYKGVVKATDEDKA